MGLTWNPLTTQIESHDWQAELYSTVSHANRIMHNLCVDVWMYISRGVFAQVPVKGATGSSTMPHKVNPIRFENAEANFEISCSLLDTLSATLVESRWQRDLTDSTTQRNIGSALGYSLLALTNLMGGLESIHPNTHVIERELDENWEVLGEPIQTAMRACELKGLPGMDKPYREGQGAYARPHHQQGTGRAVHRPAVLRPGNRRSLEGSDPRHLHRCGQPARRFRPLR